MATDYNERIRRAARRYPSVRGTVAESVESPESLGRLIRDLLSLDDSRSLVESYRSMVGANYTVEGFGRSFRHLTGRKSVRDVADLTGLTRSTVHRLLTGEQEPSLEAMEKIAAGFGKPPWWFAEYRAYVIGAMVARKLMRFPDLSARLYGEHGHD